jgi:hypothetical protein
LKDYEAVEAQYFSFVSYGISEIRRKFFLNFKWKFADFIL